MSFSSKMFSDTSNYGLFYKEGGFNVMLLHKNRSSCFKLPISIKVISEYNRPALRGTYNS